MRLPDTLRKPTFHVHKFTGMKQYFTESTGGLVPIDTYVTYEDYCILLQFTLDTIGEYNEQSDTIHELELEIKNLESNMELIQSITTLATVKGENDA